MRGIARALSHKNYRAFAIGDAVSMNGMWMQRIVVGWTAWELTESGTWLGIVAFCDLSPAIVFAPFAGAAADRWDRLRLLRWTQIAGFFLATCLLALVGAGLIEIWSLTVLTFLLGSVFAVSLPLRMSLISWLVPRKDLATAVALSSIIFNVARFLGPALAGMLIAGWGATLALVISTSTFVLFLVLLSTIRPAPRKQDSSEPAPFLRGIVDGLSYARDHPGIRALLMLMLAIGLGARPLIELLPGFASAVFDAGAEGLGAMMSSIGFGAIVGGLLFATFGAGRRQVLVISLGCWGMILCIALFLFMPTVLLAMPALGAMGCFMVLSTIGIQSSIQLATDDAMRGRVLSFFGLMLRAGPGVGALVLGAISDLVGLRLAVLLGLVGYGLVSLHFTLSRQRIEAALSHGPKE